MTTIGMAANLELLNEALEADTAFDEIPVMYVRSWVEYQATP
jgi:hypothetical protein